MRNSSEKLSQLLEDAIKAERLPPEFIETIERFYQPMADHLAKAQRGQKNGPLVVGVNGGQGSGKSTLALFLKLLLAEAHGLKTAVLSLDDLYLTRAERMALAETVHPLLITRGVPGTHDVGMGMRLLDQLASFEAVQMPHFDKAQDDRAPEASWAAVVGPVDIILFEGWCVGATAKDVAALGTPVNALERDEDPDGTWRTFVNAQLAGPYAALFARLDHLVMLKVPNFESVEAFRTLQETKLRDKASVGSGLMDDAAIRRFIMHYERLTRHMLAEMPARAEVVMELDDKQTITRAVYR